LGRGKVGFGGYGKTYELLLSFTACSRYSQLDVVRPKKKKKGRLGVDLGGGEEKKNSKDGNPAVVGASHPAEKEGGLSPAPIGLSTRQ